MWGTIAIVGVVAILAAALLTRKRKTTVDEITRYRADVSPELAGFIRVVNQVNSTDDPEYVRALGALRSASRSVLADSKRLLDAADTPYALRHSILIAVSALRESGALDLLSAVALNPQPLPPKESGGRPTIELHSGGAMEAGAMLALEALEGIEALADDGLNAALETLVQAAAVESNAVRAVALTALAARPERLDYLNRARATLPRELQHLGQMKRVSVREVPQINDPRVHLAGLEKGGPAAPAPAVGGEQNETKVAPAYGAPRAGGR